VLSLDDDVAEFSQAAQLHVKVDVCKCVGVVGLNVRLDLGFEIPVAPEVFSSDVRAFSTSAVK